MKQDTHGELKTNRDMTQCVFARISEESITPKPRWHFLMREGVVWSLGGLSVAVGALAVTVILFEMRNARWEMYDATHPTFFGFFLDAMPFVWLGTFAVFAVASYVFVRSTRGGYRYRFEMLMASSLLASGVCGTVLYIAGAGAFVDEEVGAYMPLHHPLMERERALWEVPAEGRMAGIIREISFAEPIVWIESLEGIPYELNVASFSLEDRQVLQRGDLVRVLGILSTTTAHVLGGCVVFVVPDDVLQNAHTAMKNDMQKMHAKMRGKSERNMIVARSAECESIRSYTRLLPASQ